MAVSYGAHSGTAPGCRRRIPAVRLGAPDDLVHLIGRAPAGITSGRRCPADSRRAIRSEPARISSSPRPSPDADRDPHHADRCRPARAGRAPARRQDADGRHVHLDQAPRPGGFRTGPPGRSAAATPSRHWAIAASHVPAPGSISTSATQPGAVAMLSAARTRQPGSDHMPARPAWATPTRARPDRPRQRRARGRTRRTERTEEREQPRRFAGSYRPPGRSERTATGRGEAWRPASQHDGVPGHGTRAPAPGQEDSDAVCFAVQRPYPRRFRLSLAACRSGCRSGLPLADPPRTTDTVYIMSARTGFPAGPGEPLHRAGPR